MRRRLEVFHVLELLSLYYTFEAGKCTSGLRYVNNY